MQLLIYYWLNRVCLAKAQLRRRIFFLFYTIVTHMFGKEWHLFVCLHALPAMINLLFIQGLIYIVG